MVSRRFQRVFYARLYMISALANPRRKIAIEVNVRPSGVNERTQDDDEGVSQSAERLDGFKGLKFSIQQLHRSDLHSDDHRNMCL